MKSAKIVLLKCFLLYSYGKTKESFGWPDETEEAIATAGSSTVPAVNSGNDGEQNVVNPLPVTKLER